MSTALFADKATMYLTDDPDPKWVVDVIEEETGEIVTKPVTDIQPLRQLGYLARTIRSRMQQIEIIQDEAKRQVELIQAITAGEVARIEKEIEFHAARAQEVMHGMEGQIPTDKKGRPVYSLPGQGKFTWTSGREKVEDGEFFNMPEEKQQEIITAHPDLFKVKYSPDKRAIKTWITENSALEGFTIIRPDDSFGFKPE